MYLVLVHENLATNLEQTADKASVYLQRRRRFVETFYG